MDAFTSIVAKPKTRLTVYSFVWAYEGNCPLIFATMSKLLSFLFILLVLVLPSCKDEGAATPPEETFQTTQLNESYGSDERQRFDIYLPANANVQSTPVLFLIHGGGWSSGSKNYFDGAIAGLRSAFPDYAFVTVGYRLCVNGTNQFPAQEMDVKNCIEYVLNHREEYRISEKFALWGLSAGAHLSLLYAYKYGTTSFNPRAVEEYAGPTDLIRAYDETPNDLIKLLLIGVAGFRDTADSLQYISSSPINFITEFSPPTLIMHGDADEVVPFSQAGYLRDKLAEEGVAHQYVVYTGEGHNMSSIAAADAGLQVYAFLTEHMAD